MSWGWLAWTADVLVFLGLVVMTIGVFGLLRMPDPYTQLHATSKAVFLGVIAFLVASTASRDPAIILRAILIAAALLLTTPVAAHVVALAAYRLREPMRTPGALDESGRLPDPTVADGAFRPAEARPAEARVRHIVIGYDGSEPAVRALDRVAVLADDETVVSIVTAGSILPPRSRPAAEPGSPEADERAGVLEEGAERLADRGIDVHVVEAITDPASAILQTARETGADLIVVGTRGRTRAARALLGSVSQRVLRDAPCDVLVVR